MRKKPHNLPDDLYIPPEALELVLQHFTGPMDLLLYLIKKQKFDILELPIVEITKQYMAYMEVMKAIKFDLAADYLVMAATLAHIKSALLVPAETKGDEDECEQDDPRTRLVKQLQAYQWVKNQAASLDSLAHEGRDFYALYQVKTHDQVSRASEAISMVDILLAYQGIKQRQEDRKDYQIALQEMSVQEKMAFIYKRCQQIPKWAFHQLVLKTEGREGVVASLLAMLELVKQAQIKLNQHGHNQPIELEKHHCEETNHVTV